MGRVCCCVGFVLKLTGLTLARAGALIGGRSVYQVTVTSNLSGKGPAPQGRVCDQITVQRRGLCLITAERKFFFLSVTSPPYIVYQVCRKKNGVEKNSIPFFG